MKCELCKLPATCQCTWGLYKYQIPPTKIDDTEIKWTPRDDPMNVAALCKVHSDELWKSIHGSVNSGKMHFSIKSI